MKKNISIQSLSVAGVAVSVAFVFSYFKLISLPLGGSATLFSMFFVCVIGYMYGPKYGLISAFVYSLLQFIQEPELLSPLQFLFDYILSFTALGLSGFVKAGKYRLQLSYLAGISGRFVFASISGFLFFSEYAYSAGWNNAFLYSVCYNGIYIYAEGILTLIILSIPPVQKFIKHLADFSV